MLQFEWEAVETGHVVVTGVMPGPVPALHAATSAAWARRCAGRYQAGWNDVMFSACLVQRVLGWLCHLGAAALETLLRHVFMVHV